MQFVDLDVMAIGAVVHEVTQDFDRYWAYASARPIERLLRTGRRYDTRRLAADAAHDERNRRTRFLEAACRVIPSSGELLEGRLPFEWANVRMVSDDPSKVARTRQGRGAALDTAQAHREGAGGKSSTWYRRTSCRASKGSTTSRSWPGAA